MRKIADIDTFRRNIQKKFEDLIENETKSINLEKGIYNYAIKESNNNKIIKKWDNPYFVNIYFEWFLEFVAVDKQLLLLAPISLML